MATNIDDETLEIGGVDPCTALLGDAAGGDQDEGGFGNVDFSTGEHGSADPRFPDGAQAVDDRRGREWHAVAVMGGHGEGEAGDGGGDRGGGGGGSGEIARALNKLPQRMADLAELAAVEGADYEVQARRKEAWNAERCGGVTGRGLLSFCRIGYRYVMIRFWGWVAGWLVGWTSAEAHGMTEPLTCYRFFFQVLLATVRWGSCFDYVW